MQEFLWPQHWQCGYRALHRWQYLLLGDSLGNLCVLISKYLFALISNKASANPPKYQTLLWINMNKLNFKQYFRTSAFAFLWGCEQEIIMRVLLRWRGFCFYFFSLMKLRTFFVWKKRNKRVFEVDQ